MRVERVTLLSACQAGSPFVYLYADKYTLKFQIVNTII